MPKLFTSLFTAIVILAAQPANAGMEQFHPGAVIKDYGQIADVPAAFPIPEGTEFKIAFDRMEAAANGEVNSGLVTLARFVNMHYNVGVPLEHIHGAIVVHGGAIMDVTKNAFYKGRKVADNANIKLVEELLANNVRIIVCGQSATAQSITKDDLLPGVEMALSAITGHALLQMEGYTLNPF